LLCRCNTPSDPLPGDERSEQLSWKATAKVKDLSANLTRSEKLLLLILADYHNDKTEQCDPKVQVLAEDALMGTRRVQQILTSLELKGFIRIEGREGGRRRSAQYWLTCLREKGEIIAPQGRSPLRPTPESPFAPGAKSPTPKGEIPHAPSMEGTEKEPKEEPQAEPQRARPLEERPKIFGLYENTIGLIAPHVASELVEAEALYPGDWLEDAFGEATKAGAYSWRYVQRILERWAVDGRRKEQEKSLPPEDTARGQMMRRMGATSGGR
jgi:hypothetical protein